MTGSNEQLAIRFVELPADKAMRNELKGATLDGLIPHLATHLGRARVPGGARLYCDG